MGKATLLNNHVLRISTSKGDAVKAMLAGYVRLSRKSESMGNVIVGNHLTDAGSIKENPRLLTLTDYFVQISYARNR